MKAIARTRRFRLTRTGKQFWLRTTLRNCAPTARHVSASDARYLQSLNRKGPLPTFDMSCVMDFGLAVFQA